MRVDCSITITLPVWGTFTPDWQCRTKLLVADTWLDRFAWSPFETGRAFGLQIPSGGFTGTVVRVVADDEIQHITADGRWEGQDAGLVNGLCAYGMFTARVPNRAMVETSSAGHPVRYDVYRRAREMAEQWSDYDTEELMGLDLSPQERMDLMFHEYGPENYREVLRLAIKHVEILREALYHHKLAAISSEKTIQMRRS